MTEPHYPDASVGAVGGPCPQCGTWRMFGSDHTCAAAIVAPTNPQTCDRCGRETRVVGANSAAGPFLCELCNRPIRLDVLDALEPQERQHDAQIPVNPHELDALIETVREAKVYRRFTPGYVMGEALDKALAKFDWEDEPAARPFAGQEEALLAATRRSTYGVSDREALQNANQHEIQTRLK